MKGSDNLFKYFTGFTPKVSINLYFSKISKFLLFNIVLALLNLTWVVSLRVKLNKKINFVENSVKKIFKFKLLIKIKKIIKY